MLYRLILILIVYLCFVKSVVAVTTTISNIPESITTESFKVKVTISGASAGTNYLRIDLYKPNSTNYFGETFNGLGWYSDNDYTQYYSINIESGNEWTGEFQGKIGNPNLTQYEGPGIYKLRVRRYTSSGNYSSTEANNAAVDININSPLILTITPPTESPSPYPEIPEQLISPTLTPQTYGNVYISEVMIDPETGNNEWVELYNANGFEINLVNWLIDDTENSGSTPKKFTLTIPSNNYSSVDLTGSVFNNGGDSVRLLDFTGKEIDSFQYQSSEKNKTLGRSALDNDNFCLQNPSKNNPNSGCISLITSNAKQTTSNTPIPTISEILLTPLVSSQTAAITYPFKFPIFKQMPVEKIEENTDSEVLGISFENNPPISAKNQALISSLTFASFSYSLLSIISILYKLKNNF